MPNIDSAARSAVSELVRLVETRSCAELVVEVRDRSGSYAHADARFAALAAFVALLLVIFSPWTFSPVWIALDPLVFYGIGLMLSRGSHIIRRLMTTAADRTRKVHVTAAATFVERGVSNTRRGIGVLVYLSLLERRIEVVADRGVRDAVPTLEWNRMLEATRSRIATVATLVEVLRELEPLLVCYAPILAGDKDELSNEIRFVIE